MEQGEARIGLEVGMVVLDGAEHEGRPLKGTGFRCELGCDECADRLGFGDVVADAVLEFDALDRHHVSTDLERGVRSVGGCFVEGEPTVQRVVATDVALQGSRHGVAVECSCEIEGDTDPRRLRIALLCGDAGASQVAILHRGRG
ncbi:MAG: hypothetical protein L0H03_17335 [Rhodococcus sp. (in: high G+C Gram-positive bacteria)]|nr:hypothetical protein [Rhodococcus sp. (in: high G+C Gram-positive bacteria)]